MTEEYQKRFRTLRWFANVLGVALPMVLAGSAAASRGSDSRFCGLGDLPGGTYYSEANAVSADGTVVVGASRSTGGTEALRWTASGGLEGLRDLAGGSVFSRAWDVSANGRVVVGESDSARGSEAFAWIRLGGMIGLGDLHDPSDGAFSSVAFSVSRDGRVIVGRGRAAVGRDLAFRWTPLGGLARLTDDEGELLSEASGISDDGSVVVGKAYNGSAFHAFRWTADAGLRDIGELPGGGDSSDAGAVSADGAVAVGTSESDLGTEAFRWTSRVAMTGLGGLPGGAFFSSQAFAVSADGSVIVGTSFAENGQRAFVWDVVNGIRNVEDVLVNELGVDLTDPSSGNSWILTEATGVSADGSVIVGNGINPSGYFEGWIATIAPLGCAPGILAGRVNTGDGSPPVPVFTIDGSFGDACREVTIAAGVPVTIGIGNPPSVLGAGHYALWLYDGAPVPGVSTDIHVVTARGVRFNLGLGPRCLPVSNTESPGACPCPLTFPVGRTSKPLGIEKAALLCLNSRPGFPRSPTSFTQAFPSGDFTLGGVVLDMNSALSPDKNASLGNWVVIHSR